MLVYVEKLSKNGGNLLRQGLLLQCVTLKLPLANEEPYNNMKN